MRSLGELILCGTIPMGQPPLMLEEVPVKEGTGRAHRKGGESGWIGGNTAIPSFSTRLQKNPGSVMLLSCLMQQHKHTSVALKRPPLQSHKPAGHTLCSVWAKSQGKHSYPLTESERPLEIGAGFHPTSWTLQSYIIDLKIDPKCTKVHQTQLRIHFCSRVK